MTKVLNIKDISEDTQEKNKKDEIPLDMSAFDSPEYTTILEHLHAVNINGDDFTVLDLFNIPLQSDQEIKDFIQSRLKVDIQSPGALQKINEIFQTALDFYQNRYLKNIPVNIKRKTFKNIDEVIAFLKETKTNKTTAKLNCIIAKVCYAVDGVLNHEKVERSTLLVQHFITKYLTPAFKTKPLQQDKYGNTFTSGEIILQWREIKFSFIARQKQPDSIIGKQLAEAKYDSLENFMDLIWGTFYLENDEDVALLMQYIYGNIYHWEAEISNKNGISPDIAIAWEWLHKEFHEELQKATLIGENWKKSAEEQQYDERKSSTSPDYKEIKLKWYAEVPLESGSKSAPYPIGTEIKFVSGWHDNEQWITLQNIYDYAKRFRELSRLGIPIREIDIINYVNDFFENIDSILIKKNKEKHIYYQELFQDLVSKGFLDIGKAFDEGCMLSHTPSKQEMKSLLWNIFSDRNEMMRWNGNLLQNATLQFFSQWYIEWESFIQELQSLSKQNTQRVIKRLEEMGIIYFTKSKKTPHFNEKILAVWLYKYFQSMLVQVKISSHQKVYFFDKHIIKLSQAWLFQEVEEI